MNLSDDMVDNLSGTYTISDVVMREEDKIEPLLVTFTNGTPLHSANLMGILKKHADAPHNLSNMKRILSIETPTMKYCGMNFGPQLSRLKEQLFLGIIDKTTGTAKLVEATTFEMKPQISTLHLRNVFLDNEEELNISQKQESVALDFGSKKAKVAVDRSKRYKVDLNEMTHVVEDAVESISVDTEFLQELQDDLGKFLPPCNRKAMSVENIYNLDDIISEEECWGLAEFGDKVLSSPIGESYSRLFQVTLVRLKLLNDKLRATRMTCAALFMEHLQLFIATQKGAHANVRNALKNVPGPIKTKILSEYTASTQKIVTSSLKDKARCVIIIIALIMNNYVVPLDLFIECFGMKKEKVLMYVAYVGAHFRREDGNVRLKLPLVDVPNTKRGKKRKR